MTGSSRYLARCPLILVLLSVLLGACAPAHTVKPLPTFVEAALAPGDNVIVTTTDGKTHKFVVTEIRPGVIVGKDQEIPLDEIATLQMRTWSTPKSPCGGEKTLGCSVPILIRLASDDHKHYAEQFHDACAQHDYCYRHGFKSYALSRADCDAEFLENMLASCPPPAGNVVTKALELMNDSVDSRRNCLSVAKQFHTAVRRYGDDRFLTDTGSYCEYNGPPLEAH